jgi:ribosomal RNA-processing protein 12
VISQLNIVLSAITDVIYDRRGNGPQRERPISSTEYFAALMTALEAASGTHRQEITQLLALALPVVPEPVLRAKYPAVAKCLMQVIQEADGEAALIRSGSACLGLALLAQEPSAAAWARPELLRAFQLLLALAMDPRPKIRKAGQKWTTDILELHAEHKCDALSTHIASFSENVFASASTGKDGARLVLLIAFLKSALPLLQRKVVSSLVEALAKFVSSSVKNLRLVTFEAFSALTTATSSKLTQDALVKILSIVLSADANTVQEPEVAVHAVRILETALVRLYTLNEPSAREMLPRVVVMVCAHFETPSAMVQKQSARSMLLLLSQCLPLTVLEEQATYTDVALILSSLESLMTLRFQSAWKHVFTLLADLYEFYGEASYPAFNPILKTCCELHEAAEQMPGNSKNTTDLFAKVAGAAMSAIGPRQFLQILPIDHPTEIVSEKRLWLLPLFKENLKAYPCELDFFASKFLVLARDCEAKTREDSVTPLMAKKYQMLSMQIWGLFPSFCANAVDIDSKFKNVAKVLANAMSDKRYPELRLAVCQGLQALVKKTRVLKSRRARNDYDDDDEEVEDDGEYDHYDDDDDDEEIDEEKLARDRAALGKYASRYLPILITFVEELDTEKDADSAQMYVMRMYLDGSSYFTDPRSCVVYSRNTACWTLSRVLLRSLKLLSSLACSRRSCRSYWRRPRRRRSLRRRVRAVSSR